MDKKGGISGMVTGAVGVVVLIILTLVVLQVVNVNSGNFTGINGTIVSFFGTLMLVGGLVAAAMLGIKALGRR